MNIGYCCISLGVNTNRMKKDYISVNRGMIKKTYDSKGLPYVSELCLQNLTDCKKILEYNISKDIYVYRLSSDMFPCIGFYKIKDLPKYDLIKSKMIDLGNYIKSNNIRVSFHPSHFNIIASENPDVVSRSIDELDKHAELMDMMELEQSTYYPINIHIGTTKPNTTIAAQRFCDSFSLLSDSCKSRLTVENDDSPNQYSVKMLYDMVYKVIGIPIVFDSFHHSFHPDGLNNEQALSISVSTWKTKSLCHHSSSKKIYEDKDSVNISHADYIYEKFENFGFDVDVELECKMKDIALEKYFSDFGI